MARKGRAEQSTIHRMPAQATADEVRQTPAVSTSGLPIAMPAPAREAPTTAHATAAAVRGRGLTACGAWRATSASATIATACASVAQSRDESASAACVVLSSPLKKRVVVIMRVETARHDVKVRCSLVMGQPRVSRCLPGCYQAFWRCRPPGVGRRAPGADRVLHAL